jgi:hypothetical protein
MNLRLLTTAVLLTLSTWASAQQYIYISEDGLYRVLRVNAGATQFSMTPKDSATKTAYGIHLSNEVKIISAFSEDWPVAIFDAFYFDLNMGLMSGTQQVYKTETEGKFLVCTNMGYMGMIGYRNQNWGALIGVDFRWRMASVGGVTMPDLNGDLMYFSRPIVIRGEYNLSKNDKRRLLGTFWHDGGNTTRAPYQSIRLELALDEDERWWLMTQYTHQKALGENNFMIYPASEVSFNQLTLGVRVGIMP